MNCSQARELLSAYYDNELSDDVRAAMAEHTKTCADCAHELAMFRELSTMSASLNDPQTPANMWNELEHQLDTDAVSPATRKSKRPSRLLPRWVGLAAILLVALGLVYGYRAWLGDEHQHLAANFEHYLDAFVDNPEQAHQVFLSKYEGQAVELDDAKRHLGYQPVVSKGLPDSYSLQAVYVMDMPGCKCVNCVCKKNDSRVIAIFEHDEEQPLWFGERPKITARCNGQACSIMQVDDQLVASWKVGQRNVTVVGVRDVDEVSALVAMLANKEKAD